MLRRSRVESGRGEIVAMVEAMAWSCVPTFLQFTDLCGQLFVLQGGLAQFNECANNKDAHPDCTFAVEYVGRHDGAVLSEDERKFPETPRPLRLNS